MKNQEIKIHFLAAIAIVLFSSTLQTAIQQEELLCKVLMERFDPHPLYLQKFKIDENQKEVYLSSIYSYFREQTKQCIDVVLTKGQLTEGLEKQIERVSGILKSMEEESDKNKVYLKEAEKVSNTFEFCQNFQNQLLAAIADEIKASEKEIRKPVFSKKVIFRNGGKFQHKGEKGEQLTNNN